MRLRIGADLEYRFAAPTAVLLALEVAPGEDQRVVADRLTVDGSGPLRTLPGECGIGRRTWADADGRFVARYAATIDVTRAAPDWARLVAVPPAAIPADAVQFLWPSRYCQSDRLCAFAGRTFGGLSGGLKVAAMADWIRDKLAYVAGSSDATTTALDSFVRRQGVCRDYAHLMVSFARAADIPARMVAAYGLGVDPPDFHAVTEVWLADGAGAGAWRMIDATGMCEATGLARIAVGRDATDISFMTSFGRAELVSQNVRVDALGQEQPTGPLVDVESLKETVMTDQRTHPTGPDHAGEESMGIGPPPPGGDEGSEAIEGALTGDEDHPAHHPGQDAGQDRTLRQRLRDDPDDLDARIDVGSDESMDASDPPSTSAPGRDMPMPSSGFIE